MSNDQPSWRSLAGAASRSIKGYVAQRELRRPISTTRDVRAANGADASNRATWSQWAGQKLRSIGQGGGNVTMSSERLSLFPGWACRRYRQPGKVSSADDPQPFDVDIYIAGFAARSSGMGFSSRAGKAFLRLAKGYASLPKLALSTSAETSYPQGGSSRPDELLGVRLPPRPEDMTEEAEFELLNQYRHTDADQASLATESSASSRRSVSPTRPSPQEPTSPSDLAELRKQHSNLESRLFPFWSTSLGARAVRIAVYAVDPSQLPPYSSPALHEEPPDEDDILARSPLITSEVMTAADGSFKAQFSLSWEQLCRHPGMIGAAFGPVAERDFFVVVELLPGASTSTPATQVTYAVRTPRYHHAVYPTDTRTLVVPLTHSQVRLISDIDDTVKMSGILGGARAAFHNVFVKDLSESIIPGMGDWYMDMWRRGVRFHYVSNSPFELLPVINEFIELSKLPPGSVKLKSYAGRSLFNGLLTAPAERKRAGMLEILDSFSDARFFLVGDSGEQDLELYASLARERPPQILGIFIRDASNHSQVRPLNDPTGRSPPPPPTTRRETRSSPGPTTTNDAPPLPRRPTARSVPSFLSSQSFNNFTSPIPRRKPSRAAAASSPPPIREEPGGDYFPAHGQGQVQVTDPAARMLVDAPISDEPKSLSFPPPGFARANTTTSLSAANLEIEDYFSSSSSSRSSSNASSARSTTPLTDAERRQSELQLRVYRARLEMPDHIPLRVFREPKECVEAWEVLDRLNMGEEQLLEL